MGDFQFADIIFLAVIAVFILLRLRHTLGKDVGFDPRENLHKAATEAQADPHVVSETIEDVAPKEDEAFTALPEGSLAEDIRAIKAADASFNMDQFLHGARTAFEWVFEAFHKGDKATLKSLLSPEIYTAFEAEIIARDAANETSDATLVAVHEAKITEAKVVGKQAQITVSFDTEQVHLLRNANGDVIEGDASLFEHVKDEWVFARDVNSKSPNWIVLDT